MRQICVLQLEEIKTKNSGATHHFCGKRPLGVESKYIAIVFSILTRNSKIICIRSNLIYYLVFKYIRLNQERYSYKETPYFCLQKGCLNSTEFVYIPPRNCSTFLFKKAMGVPNVYSLI